MRISVVVPCHNAAPYLAQTLGSVLDQTHPPVEVIVVDDGSTDGSLALARRFEERSGGVVRVLAQEKAGAPAARNHGAMATTGEALMFLDADDVLGPDTLAALAEALPPAGFAGCRWRRLELIDGRWMSRPASCAPRRPDQDALAGWLTGWYYPPCAMLWSREALAHIGGWDESLTINQDGDLVMRALAAGLPLAETAAGSAFYRRAPHSVSGRGGSPEGIRGRLSVLCKIARLLAEEGRIDPYRPALRQAFNRVAEGAPPDLAAEARRLARHHGPALPAHVAARLRARPAPSPPAAPVSQEVTAGLRRAEGVLAAPRHAVPSFRVKRPLVSVVIPTFRRPDLLPRALASVLAQTVSDLEVLVVDDGQCDATAEVVQSFGDRRLRYLRQPVTGGPARGRNRGMREAGGTFVALLDDDDEWLPEKLAKQLPLFERPEVGLVYTGLEVIRAAGQRPAPWPEFPEGDLSQRMLVQNVVQGSAISVVFRRNLLSRAGFQDPRFPAIEDYDHMLRLCRTCRVAAVAEPLVRYYDDRTGDTARVSRHQLNDRAARALFWAKHRADMRQAGVEHLVLRDLAERHMLGPAKDFAGARRWAARAVAAAPRDRAAWELLLRLSAPPGAGRLLRGLRPALRTPSPPA